MSFNKPEPKLTAKFYLPEHELGNAMQSFYHSMTAGSFRYDVYWNMNHKSYGISIKFRTEEDLSMFCLRFGEYLDE